MENKEITLPLNKEGSEESNRHFIITNNKIIISPFFSTIIKVIILFGLFQIILNFLELNKIIDVSRKDNEISNIIILLIFNTGLIIGFLIHKYYNSQIFDFQNGYFYYGKYRKNFLNLVNNKKFKRLVFALNNINSIQILGKELEETHKNGSYKFMCYELNLILQDNSRVNILNHGYIDEIRENANKLGKRLGVEVYDLTKINAKQFLQIGK